MFAMESSRPHSQRKRMVSNVFSKSYLHSSPELAEITATVLRERLLPKLSRLRSAIDVVPLFSAVTMDIVSAYKFGLRAGSHWFDNEEERDHLLELYHSRKKYSFWLAELPSLTKLLKRLRLSPIPAWVDSANNELEAWCLAMCDAADEASTLPGAPPPKRNSGENIPHIPVVYSHLKSALLKSIPKGASPKQSLRLTIASELLDQAAAGFETSTITLTYLAYRLSQQPTLQSQLRDELLTLTPPVIQSHHSLFPSAKDADALPILNACLMETLRLHAAIPGSQPRVTPWPSCSLGAGENVYDDIPGGVRVAAQAYSLHRNPIVFPEPEAWLPERWLNRTEDGRVKSAATTEMMRWFWAFGSGGRMCVGSNLAVYVMKFAVAAIYTNYSTRIVDDTGIEAMDAYVAGPKHGRLMLKFEVRDA